jgi:hypothetical protein
MPRHRNAPPQWGQGWRKGGVDHNLNRGIQQSKFFVFVCIITIHQLTIGKNSGVGVLCKIP